MRRDALCLMLLLGAAAPAFAADPAIAFDAAWAPAAEKGADTSLYVTVENAGADDAIIRVRCEAANFTELRTLDHGEGFPSARSVKAIPLAGHGQTVLAAEGLNIHLLQLTRPLVPGEAFDCALRLRGGSQHTVAVSVRPADAQPE